MQMYRETNNPYDLYIEHATTPFLDTLCIIIIMHQLRSAAYIYIGKQMHPPIDTPWPEYCTVAEQLT